MKDILKPIIVLTCICLVVTTLLAVVNFVTAPIILAAEEEAAAKARSEVLTQAKSFELMKDVKLPEGVTEAYKGNDETGYVFMLETKGYGGTIKLICGIRTDGTMESIKTLSHSETSGIGSKVVDNATGYNKNYSGKTAADYESVDFVTGATISSKAYRAAVKTAFDAYSAVKGVK